jgi:TPP-dependent 2-oxoacid decarboxylase
MPDLERPYEVAQSAVRLGALAPGVKPGDGAAQLTAQEIGTLQREECAPIVVINNDRYTIKRAFPGPHQRYHNILRWNWALLPPPWAARRCGQRAPEHRASSLRPWTASPVPLTWC